MSGARSGLDVGNAPWVPLLAFSLMNRCPPDRCPGKASSEMLWPEKSKKPEEQQKIAAEESPRLSDVAPDQDHGADAGSLLSANDCKWPFSPVRSGI